MTNQQIITLKKSDPKIALILLYYSHYLNKKTHTYFTNITIYYPLLPPKNVTFSSAPRHLQVQQFWTLFSLQRRFMFHLLRSWGGVASTNVKILKKYLNMYCIYNTLYIYTKDMILLCDTNINHIISYYILYCIIHIFTWTFNEFQVSGRTEDFTNPDFLETTRRFP